MMKIVQMKTEDLIPYPNNPRDNDDGVDAVVNSIREFGFQQPIVVDKNNVVIVGHTRLKAAEKLGLEKVPVVIADLSEDKANAYRLADNKTGELSRWDFIALQEELDNIEIDMDQFGFDEKDISFIDDIMDEALGEGLYKNDLTDFAITFVISKEYEETIYNYIRENGKQGLIDAMIAEARHE